MDNPNTKGQSALATTASSATDTQLHFLDYWRVIRIRKTVIFVVFLLVVITTTVVTYWLPKYFASTVRIAVEKDSSETPGLFEFRPTANSYDPYFIQTEFEKIQSKAVLYNVISNLHLSTKWAKKYEIAALDMTRTYKLLKGRLDVRQYRNTTLIEIKVMDEDPQEAVDIANEIAKAYGEQRRATKMKAANMGIAQLKDDLKKADEQVNQKLAIVNAIRETNQISDAVADGVQTSVLETETIRRLESRRIEALTEYTKMDTLHKNLASLSKPMLRNVLPRDWPDTNMDELLRRLATTEQQLATLDKDLGPEHPDVKRARALLEKVNEQIDTTVEAIMRAIQVRVETYATDYKVATTELDVVKSNDIFKGKIYGIYALAKRDLDMERQLRQTLAMKITQENIDSRRSYNSIVEIIDQAEPGIYPVRPNIPVNIALGVVVGLIVGIGLAFFIEYLDTSVKTIDDVERALGAPVLGVIPQNVGALLEEGPDSPHAEAYRVLRTNLLFARKNEKANTITIISGGAGEGKSTTVINLATIFAQNGQRVLVVDSDLRRPSLHKFLKISNALGLTNYLLKQKTLEEVVQTTSLASLDFLPSGKLPSSSMGILNSTRMREFIKEVRLRYDVVFFDSPPIMGVSDASVLASEVDMTLLVVQYRKYPQVMTLRAKQMVEKVGGNLMGVVLNNINISQDSYYYYYSGYYYDYYSKRDEDGEKGEGKDGKKSSSSKTPGDLAKLDVKEK
jgi:polysaccharide biosynthesis transport protein